MDQSYWKEQLYKYRMRSLTGEEEELLLDAWADTANAEGWKQIMKEMFQEQAPGEEYQPSDWEPVLQAVFNSDRTAQPAVVRRMPIVRRYAVAAVILTLLGTGTWWMVQQRMTTTMPVGQATKSMDVPAPATNRATITLAGGQQVFLDSAGNGALARQGNVQVVKMANGQVAYKVEDLTNRELLYNTLTNPRGSQVMNLTLADGTRVWLNAESSIRYPVAFNGQDRTVEMTGEAYFEVAKDKKKPFHVNANGVDVEVLGTHFNINAYPDETSIKTTLLEGKVKLGKAGANMLLNPGEQGQTDSASGFVLVKNADMNEAVAWKNGFFSFEDANIQAVMRQLERWYGIKVKFEGKPVQGSFGGKMGRDLSLTQVLTGLSKNDVHFHLEGTTLTVLP